MATEAVLHDKDLVPSLWLAAFAALIGTSLTNEHNALLQHPLIPPQFPSRVIAPLLAGDVAQLRTTSLKSSPALVPRGQSKTDVPAVRAHSLPLTMHPFKSSRVPLWILSLGSPNWQFSSTMHRTSLALIWLDQNLSINRQKRTLHSCFFFFLVSRTRHHSCAGHCFTIRSHCNFFRNATIPPGRIKQQKKTKQTATKQNQQRNTNQTQTENQTPEWKLSSLFLYNVQLK